MWGRLGLKEVISNGSGMCFFKFGNEEGMYYVVENGPWMVRNKPLVQKWNPLMNMEMNEPTVIPLWVRLMNVLMEAWTVKGISKIASSLGKPIIMDAMTTNLCQYGSGRVGYARVLVEIAVKNGFQEEIEICYRDDENNTIGVKKEFMEKELLEKTQKQNKEEFISVLKNKKVRIRGKRGTLKPKKDKGVRIRIDSLLLRWRISEAKEKEVVDEFIVNKKQPSLEETRYWTQNMIHYFKKRWEEMERNVVQNVADEEDVFEEENGIATNGMAG
ncbi:RNA-directed DNA polymerase, eukaryota, reverse transcriptase zinc-binding domain protein [Tanacetum coccineum]